MMWLPAGSFLLVLEMRLSSIPSRTEMAMPVRALTSDPDPVVAEAARWALAELTAGP